ncbi:uncharacterized protein At4g17910 isoform X2 [Olea europaea var. sylvestris]|uniref:uncharacterized protein At4g17910 isoform X2 n=1 Tax=Olea europaea var. sylvestris TaxID=158386 RepID=UPI000C1D5991|nr:uncharacterized protein At4g17910 isoform X2 [Olea europaea var. sylvestris]
MDSTDRSFNPSKHLKEQFVSNLTGSSKLEISLLLTTFSVLILIRRCIGFNYDTTGPIKKNDASSDCNKNLRAYIAALVVDSTCIVVPYILFLTVLAEWTCITAISMILLLLFMIAVKRNGSSFLQERNMDSIRANISTYRVSMMLVTCLCILAVDFKIFPRRYAKTETYGTGLMDLGVGSFVLVNSLVSRKARGISNMTVRNALCSTSPLIFLGFARLISTRSVDYQVHVGEYGVHWNFFFTLAAVSILTSIFNVPPHHCGTLGSLILIGYQVFLSSGLNKYLLSEKRGTDLMNQNKEGIFSIFGYWGMYLIGVRIGNYLFFENNVDTMLRNNKRTRTRVWFLCFFFWLTTLFLDWHVERVSRRTCNLAYVSLVLAINLQVLSILMLSDYLPGGKVSAMEEAFNRNLLGSFLLANILTGLVNLSIDTLLVPPIFALAILFAYGFILSFAVGFADFLGIKLKFW